jgi:hypothetical protein
MLCNVCDKEITEDETYSFGGKCMCEDCAIKEGLYPLGHTGLRRDKISERGRRLTLPKHDKK